MADSTSTEKQNAAKKIIAASVASALALSLNMPLIAQADQSDREEPADKISQSIVDQTQKDEDSTSSDNPSLDEESSDKVDASSESEEDQGLSDDSADPSNDSSAETENQETEDIKPNENVIGATKDEESDTAEKQDIDEDAQTESIVATVDGKEFDDLQSAIDSIDANGTVALADDIEMRQGDTIVVPSGKTVKLDMAGHAITATSDFVGRPIDNQGTLTVTGNGTISTEAAGPGGYGAVNNKGTLTIVNGNFAGHINGDGSVIRNTGTSSVLNIQGGVFTGSPCSVYNEGSATLNGGRFVSESCSSCTPTWSYALRNVTAQSKMVVNDAEVIGTQGALSAANGYLEVNGGHFKTVNCAHGHGAVFYALYLAGEIGEVKGVINGGVFETEGKHAAALIGNGNLNGDGGINEQAVAEINGGTFKAPQGVPSLKRDAGYGIPQIKGGSFTSDVGEFVAPGSAQFERESAGQTLYVVETLNEENSVVKVDGGDGSEEAAYFLDPHEALEAAEDGQTVSFLKPFETDRTLSVDKSLTIEGNGNLVTSTASRILWIDKNDVNVTLRGLTFADTGKSERGIQVNQNITGVKLSIEECSVPATYYAVNICSGVQVDLNIKDSEIKGWGALNLWGSNYDVKVSDSTLIGINDKAYNADGWNGFGTIVLEGDTTGNTDASASGCSVELANCNVVASSMTDNKQRAILFNSQSNGNSVRVTGSNTVFSYPDGQFCFMDGTDNSLVVTGGHFSDDGVREYCADGFEIKENANGGFDVAEPATNPVEPPEQPENPGPSTPVAPSQPATPSTPTNPSNPSTTTKPSKPSKPNKPSSSTSTKKPSSSKKATSGGSTTTSPSTQSSGSGTQAPQTIDVTAANASGGSAGDVDDAQSTSVDDDAQAKDTGAQTGDEWIQDDATPLAEGPMGESVLSGDSENPSDDNPAPFIASGLGIGAVAAGLIAFLVGKRRRKKEEDASLHQ